MSAYSRTLGQWNDAMPEGGSPRAAMGPLESVVTHRESYQPHWYILQRLDWSDWWLPSPYFWDRLVAIQRAGGLASGYVAGRDSVLDPQVYDAFVAADGNFELFSDMIGRKPFQGIFENLPHTESRPTILNSVFTYGLNYLFAWTNEEISADSEKAALVSGIPLVYAGDRVTKLFASNAYVSDVICLGE